MNKKTVFKLLNAIAKLNDFDSGLSTLLHSEGKVENLFDGVIGNLASVLVETMFAGVENTREADHVYDMLFSLDTNSDLGVVWQNLLNAKVEALKSLDK